MKWTEYTKKLLVPEIAVPVVYVIFLIFAFVSYNISTLEFRKAASPLSYVISIFAILALIFFIRAGRTLKNFPQVAVLVAIFVLGFMALNLAFSMPQVLVVAISGGYAVVLWAISKRLDKIKLITYAAIALAVIPSIGILLKGIPIVDVFFREAVAVSPLRAFFHGFAVFSATLLVVFHDRKFVFGVPILALLGVVLGFKSDAIAILGSATVAGLLVKKLSARDVLIVFAGVIFILTIISTYIANTSYGEWGVHPILYIFYRAGFTLSVFSRVVDASFPFGVTYGRAILSPAQQIASVEVLGYKTPHIITSTLIGPGMLDFGVIGVVALCALVGIYLGALHERTKTPFQACVYAIALTHTFILVEVGLQLTSIILYLSLLYLSVESEKIKIEENPKV